MLHAPRNVINLHFVSEADVFAEVKVRDLQVKIAGGVLDEGGGEAAVSVGIGDAPSVNKYNNHGGSTPGFC